jgi:peptidoglycan/LPS O-acetylase OafA/YrhL
MRRVIGRGRFLIGAGAILALVAMALPWVTVGDSIPDLTPTQRNGFDPPGLLLFVASICLLALLLLPYASRTGDSGLDRPMSYAVAAGAGVIGFVIEAAGLFGEGHLRLPDKAPGLWLAGLGLCVICWGVGELLGDRPSTV